MTHGPTAKAVGIACRAVCGLLSKPQSSQQANACPRGHVHVGLRKPASLLRYAALLLGAYALCRPAKLLPFMYSEQVFRFQADTIPSGIVLLWVTGARPLAVVVFVASIVVQLAKLLALTCLVVSVRLGSRMGPVARVRTFRIVRFIGRWSMLDIFVATMLTAAIHVKSIAAVRPGARAIAFAAVVHWTRSAKRMQGACESCCMNRSAECIASSGDSARARRCRLVSCIPSGRHSVLGIHEASCRRLPRPPRTHHGHARHRRFFFARQGRHRRCARDEATVARAARHARGRVLGAPARRVDGRDGEGVRSFQRHRTRQWLLNQPLAQANTELADANAALRAEKSRELETLNASLAVANSELEQTNLALQTEIAQRIRAQVALEEADRRKDDFLAMLSHDLRNPLAALQGAIELMRRVPIADPQLDRARSILVRRTGI